MIDVNATSIFVAIIWTIGIGVFGFWLHGMLTASKQDEPEDDELEFMGCVRDCGRRRTPKDLMTDKMLNICKRLYLEYCKRCVKEKGVRVGEPCEQDSFSSAVADSINRTTPSKRENTLMHEGNDGETSEPLCSACDHKDECKKRQTALETRTEIVRCTGYDHEGEDEPSSKGSNIDETV